ncbi:MAG: glucose-6-phosphate isomerase [Gammaproteobacteria bacterium]|nr:glucose-6-phosphate isomerase [Gammaproteobacteria bacterium]
MELRIDTRLLYADAVGAEGVSSSELTALTPKLERVHSQLTERTRGEFDAEYACLNLHTLMPPEVDAIEAEAARLRGFGDLLVLGIGGSNLGAMAVLQALSYGNRKSTGPRLHFIDNIDPDYLRDLLASLSAHTTAVITISKSGGTIETATQYLIVRQWLRDALGETDARTRQWIVTDPIQGWLRKLASAENLPTLAVPPRVGGRYSVLTAVGLLPLAAAGVDIRALLDGARVNAARCQSARIEQNAALEVAALYFLLDTAKQKRLSILMPYINSLRLFGDWYRQLWAESLGKRRADDTPAGTLPVTALGAVDQHSQLQMYLESRRDKVFAFLALDRWSHDVHIPLTDTERAAFPYLAGKTLNEVIAAEFLATRQVIADYGHPLLTIHLPVLSAHTLGQLIDLYQRVTVYAGLLYGINPLDQPAVESGKQLTLQNLQSVRHAS